jgi:exodeoxyribonuclease VIII
MTTHATIDIETLATSPDAVVLTIGGIKFDPLATDDLHSEFYYRVDADEQIDLGRAVDEDTLIWWGKQDADVQAEALDPEGRISVNDTLKALNKWLVGVDKIWCQGPVFDITILENLYRNVDLHYNWSFWNIRDSRTLFGLVPKDPRKEIDFAAHNALADAIVQSLCIQKVYKQLGVS